MVCVAILASSSVLFAENWPQWRGPSLNGISAEKNLPVRWSATENVVWKLAMPERSGSTPIVWGDHVFLNVGEGASLTLWAINRSTGTVRWKAALGDGNRRMQKQQMSSPSPVTDGRSVWVMTGTGVLKAFDFSGKELWARNIQNDYGRFGLQWGYASSPLLHEDSLFVQVLHRMILRIFCGSTRRLGRLCGAWSDPRTHGSSPPTPTRRPHCFATRARRRLSSRVVTW
jgi:hypothetical protein